MTSDKTVNKVPLPIALVAATILASFAALVWSAAATKSETIDEGLFIGGGVAQVELANPNIDLSHPPLLRWVAGLSAIYFGEAKLPDKPTPLVPVEAMDLDNYYMRDIFDWTPGFFYHPGHSHDEVLFWGRFPFAFLAMLAGILVFMEVRRRAGDYPALAALLLFAFTPEVLAHSQWAHSDIASALTVLILALALARSLEKPTVANDLLTGAALGLAVLAKLTALMLIPLVTILIIVFHDTPPGRVRTLWMLRRVGLIAVLAYGVIVAGYLPEPRAFVAHQFVETDMAQLIGADPGDTSTKAVSTVLKYMPLPDSLLKGIVYTKLLAGHGSHSYFHGETRSTGWWYYYPVALLLKYPPPLLLLAALGLVATLRSSALSLRRKLTWILPPAVIVGFAMTNAVNIGVRSILPVAPFLALWCGLLFARIRQTAPRVVAVGLITLSVWSGFSAYPNFLTYFNPLAGGTPAADRWLVDSNLDWGQDLPELARTMQRRNIPFIRLAYFGGGWPSHWGIRYRDANVREVGWYAVSRTFLSGWWPHGDPYAWLREIPPTELVGGSIALIEVRPEHLAR